jgi:hypothetical protein
MYTGPFLRAAAVAADIVGTNSTNPSTESDGFSHEGLAWLAGSMAASIVLGCLVHFLYRRDQQNRQGQAKDPDDRHYYVAFGGMGG